MKRPRGETEADFDDLVWLPRRASAGAVRVVLSDLVSPEFRRRKPLTEFPVGLDSLDQVLTATGAAKVDYAFLPERQAREEMARSGGGLQTLGVRGQPVRPVREAAVLGINMMNHLQIPALLALLELCRIPILREERSEKDPLVVVGGHAWPNPLPISDFVDVVVGGEGEDTLSRIATVIAESSSRTQALRAIAPFQGAFVPAHPRRGIAPARVQVASPRIPAGSSSVLRGVGAVVLSRGCPYSCAFCTSVVAGGPYRIKPWDQVAAHLQALASAGAERVVLLAASAGAWRGDRRSVVDVVAEARRLGLRVRPMSDRPDTLEPATLPDLAADRGKVCLAPETSPRLRRTVLQKTITEPALEAAIDTAVAAGVPHIRFYTVVAIPDIPAGTVAHLPNGTCGESDDDHAYLAELAWRSARRLRARHPHLTGPRVSLDCMPLLPTLGTPLAGLRYPTWESYQAALARLTSALARGGEGDVSVVPALDWPTWFLQGYLERAGPSAGRQVLAAWRSTGAGLADQQSLAAALRTADPALAFTNEPHGPLPHEGIWAINESPPRPAGE